MTAFRAILNEARTGDVILFSGRKLFSRVIQARSLSQWSHVGIIQRIPGETPGTTMPVIIESLEGHGVRIVPASAWTNWNGHCVVGRVQLNDQHRDAVAAYAARFNGCPYAPWRQFARSFSFGWRWTARALSLPSDLDERSWFCSELVAASLCYGGGIVLPKEPVLMTPADIADLPCVVWYQNSIVSLPCAA